jgi:hypothetical protein
MSARRRRVFTLPTPAVPRPGPLLAGLYLASILLTSTLLFGALLTGLSPTPALADDTAVGGIGGDVYPLSNTDIRMEAETVQAVCYRGFAEYRVDFRFVNEGEPQTVRLGFPFVVTISGDMGTAPVAFRAWQDGEPLAVTLGRGVSSEDVMFSSGPLGYYLHEATFPRGKTIITVSYLARPTVSAGSRFYDAPEWRALNIPGWCASYDYWLHTGAGWSGTIGKAVVRYRLADTFNGWALDINAADVSRLTAEGGAGGPTTSPESYVKLDDRTYQWVFEDLEPTGADDILLAFTTPSFSGDPGIAFPPAYGAFAGTGGASGQLGSDSGMPPGWEAIDRSPETAWGIAAPGIGGWIQTNIFGNQNLREIRILPGRNDSLSSFKEYGRPKTIKVTLSDGTSATITLADEPALQKFAVSGTADNVRFDILDIYPGSKSNDTYMSEIDFGTEPAPKMEPFSVLIAEQAPPSTQPPTTQSSPAIVSPMTTQAQGSTPTTGGPATTIAGGEGNGARQVWLAFVAFAVAVVALGALAFLLVKLRTRGRAAQL